MAGLGREHVTVAIDADFEHHVFPLQLEDNLDIIPHLYEKFKKADFAVLCKDIASCKASFTIPIV